MATNREDIYNWIIQVQQEQRQAIRDSDHDLWVNKEIRQAYEYHLVSYKHALAVLEEQANPNSLYTLITKARLRDERRTQRLKRTILWVGVLIMVVLIMAIIVLLH